MNNEPVAWLHIQGNHFEASDRQLFDDEIERGWEQKPLYTHPHSDKSVKAKTLTDDEIEEFAYAFQLWQMHNPDKALEGIMAFAKAILRKAQEK